MFKHILVPTDGSPYCKQAARQAVTLAQGIGARITAFHAKSDYPISFLGEGGLIDPFTPESFAEMTEQQSSEYLGEIEALCASAHVPCDVLSNTSSQPYLAIIEAAESTHCDLIFMSSHGRRGLSSLLLGSETNKVLAHTSIPVLVYRKPPDAS